ncbi:helix-turn-helix transcriptional regulator [Actinosynnema sp. NPDC023587]|uniref:helix-turn-helix domain-containing protein n=1 Tax=Actinosynnema sp. NPDC023587 TaxID=3154695 RepID=UPI0033E5A8FD
MNQRLVALELLQLRMATEPRLERKDVAKALGCATSRIGHLETARNQPSYTDLRTITDLYGRPDRLEVLWLRTSLSRQRGWWEEAQHRGVIQEGPDSFREYIGLEQGCSHMLFWDPLAVTGLFQTADYAQAVIRAYDKTLTDQQVRDRAVLRIRRQEVIGRAKLHVVLGETALRPVGGREVFRAQLEHLARTAEHPNVTLQVLLNEVGAHPGQHGPFTIMGFPADPEVHDPGLVYVETLLRSTLYDEDADIAAYTTNFGELADLAASPGRSADLIHRLIKEQAA